MRVDRGAFGVAWRVLDSRVFGEDHRRTRPRVVTRPWELGRRRIVGAGERDPCLHHLPAERVGLRSRARERREVRAGRGDRTRTGSRARGRRRPNRRASVTASRTGRRTCAVRAPRARRRHGRRGRGRSGRTRSRTRDRSVSSPRRAPREPRVTASITSSTPSSSTLSRRRRRPSVVEVGPMRIAGRHQAYLVDVRADHHRDPRRRARRERVDRRLPDDRTVDGGMKTIRPPRRSSSATCAARISSPGTSRRSRTRWTPTASASSSARRLARSRGAAVGTPLCTIIRWNKPDAAGDAASSDTSVPPADSPNRVTFVGVAAERTDLVAHPLERGDEIEDTPVAAHSVVVVAGPDA